MTRKPSQTEHTLSLFDQQIRYIAVSEWQTLFDQEKPVAEMFHVYLAEANESIATTAHVRLMSGPGAASAYLHMGARSEVSISVPRQPAQTSSTVVDNAESWLIFTDLVFIDPIGTGFSRSLPQDKDIQDKSGEKANPSQADKPKETEFGKSSGT